LKPKILAKLLPVRENTVLCIGSNQQLCTFLS
jgi:hypothetical protein